MCTVAGSELCLSLSRLQVLAGSTGFGPPVARSQGDRKGRAAQCACQAVSETDGEARRKADVSENVRAVTDDIALWALPLARRGVTNPEHAGPTDSLCHHVGWRASRRTDEKDDSVMYVPIHRVELSLHSVTHALPTRRSPLLRWCHGNMACAIWLSCHIQIDTRYVNSTRGAAGHIAVPRPPLPSITAP